MGRGPKKLFGCYLCDALRVHAAGGGGAAAALSTKFQPKSASFYADRNRALMAKRGTKRQFRGQMLRIMAGFTAQ